VKFFFHHFDMHCFAACIVRFILSWKVTHFNSV